MTRPPDVRAAHDEQQAALTDADLRAGPDIVVDPKPKDWATIQGTWVSWCTTFNPHPPDEALAVWAQIWADEPWGTDE